MFDIEYMADFNGNDESLGILRASCLSISNNRMETS